VTREPRIEHRAEQPYVAIAARVASEAELRSAVDSGFPELFGWLAENDVAPTGPPFIRFLELDGDGQPVEFEIAAPIAATVSGTGRIQAGALPAGRYATFLHVGPYSHADVPDLDSARSLLLDWADQNGVGIAGSETDGGTAFEACVEHYLTDASREPDWSKWETELAYLVAAIRPGTAPARG
jgi:effector-binding domain-containing protein